MNENRNWPWIRIVLIWTWSHHSGQLGIDLFKSIEYQINFFFPSKRYIFDTKASSIHRSNAIADMLILCFSWIFQSICNGESQPITASTSSFAAITSHSWFFRRSIFMGSVGCGCIQFSSSVGPWVSFRYNSLFSKRQTPTSYIDKNIFHKKK